MTNISVAHSLTCEDDDKDEAAMGTVLPSLTFYKENCFLQSFVFVIVTT